MRVFTKEEIDEQREKFVSQNYLKQRAELDNRTIDYFVLPTKLFQGLPNGLFRMTGSLEDGYLVGVSQEVPESIKDYFAMSEHDEFMVYGSDDKDKTLHSEQNMLKILEGNKELRNQYIDNKLMLYTYMLEHAKDNLDKWFFTQEDYTGFQRAAEFLKSEKH